MKIIQNTSTYLIAMLTLCLLTLATLSACSNSFLEQAPEKKDGIRITSLEHLDMLISTLTEHQAFSKESSLPELLCSDAFEMPSTIAMQPFVGGAMPAQVHKYYVWDFTDIRETKFELKSWADYYKNIYYTNLILYHADRVPGDEDRKTEIRGMAHFLRAFYYSRLAQIYCMPYGPKTKTSPGLPIKTDISYTIETTRGTLEELYSFITQDLEQAIALIKRAPMDGEQRTVRPSKAAAYALMARHCLLTEQYPQAEKNAQKALDANFKHLDLNSGVIKNTITSKAKVEVSNLYNSNLSSNPRLIGDLADAYFLRLNNYIPMMIWLHPSGRLLSLYNSDYDLRHKLFVCKDFSAEFVMPYFPMPNHIPGYVTFFMEIQMAPTAAEMYLIKAEAQARSGKVTEAMQTLNAFRRLRMALDTPDEILNITATNAQEAIGAILDERFREAPFSLRWLDIRRCNFNSDANDDLTIERTYYPVSSTGVDYKGVQKTYTLTPSSKNYVLPIPDTDINLSNNSLVQNDL